MEKKITKLQLKKLVVSVAFLSTSLYGPYISTEQSDDTLYTVFDALRQYGVDNHLDSMMKNNIIKALWAYSTVVVTDTQDAMQNALKYALRAVGVKPRYVWFTLDKAVQCHGKKQDAILDTAKRNIMNNTYPKISKNDKHTDDTGTLGNDGYSQMKTRVY